MSLTSIRKDSNWLCWVTNCCSRLFQTRGLSMAIDDRRMSFWSMVLPVSSSPMMI